MKNIQSGRKIKTGVSIILLVSALALGILGFSNRPTQPYQAELLDGITFADSFSKADQTYLQISLRWLHDYLPEWYAYVAQAQPITLAIDEEMQTRRIISNARCCSMRGAGTITFGEHLGQWQIPTDAIVKGMQAQQIQFLSVLIHETTHIRDLRVGRVKQAVDPQTCIAAEKSANDQELEFVRSFKAVQIKDDATGQANYRLSVDRHLQVTEENANSASWKIFCLLSFMNNIDSQ